MAASDERRLERLRYRAGQLLRSKDFRDQQTIETQLRGWHNRALHNAYGIAKGALGTLAVKEMADQRGVTVETGIAYDYFGSELVLANTRTVQFTSAQDPMFLVIRRQNQHGGHKSDPSPACFMCSAGGAIDTELVWMLVKDFSFRDGVPLARTRLSAGTVRLDPNFRARHARAFARPQIATGTTIPGATSWEVWDIAPATRASLPMSQLALSLQVRIDISSAGFTTPPDCFAFLQGPLVVKEESEDPEAPVAKVSLYFEHVDEVTIHSFVFRFLIILVEILPGSKSRLGRDVRRFLTQQKDYVSWLAIENQERESLKSKKTT